MTMQSYFWSGTGRHNIDAPPELLGDRPGFALGVVVADEHPVPVGDQAAVALGAHLEAELQARPGELARPHEGPDLLVEERRRSVVDVALGEDEAELVLGRRLAARHERAYEVDSCGLEEAQELDVVQVLQRVQVAEADTLDHREPLVRGHGRRSGIWMRAIALTRNQKSVPEAAITDTVRITAATLLAISRRMLKSTIVNASTACRTTTAQ